MSERIVDAHHHLWDTRLGRHPWLCEQPRIGSRYGDYEAICRPYLAPDYRRDAAGFELAGSVYVEAEWDPRDPIGETRWVHEQAEAHGLPSAMVAQGWLDAEDVEATLAAQSAFPLVRGVRHKPATFHGRHAPPPFARGAMSDARWRRGYALLERFGLSFDLQCPWWHLEEAAELARAHPGVALILDHTGIPSDRSDEGLALWAQAIRTLAGEPNACVKISGLGIPGTPWTVEAQRRVVLETVDAFGVERCMLASNFPVDSLCADFATIYRGFAEILAELTDAERRALLADNAVRIYRIDSIREDRDACSNA